MRAIKLSFMLILITVSANAGLLTTAFVASAVASSVAGSRPYTHTTIIQNVISEEQGLYDEYSRNLETIKSSKGTGLKTVEARNRDILDIFKRKAIEKYNASFEIGFVEIDSKLLETKTVTGVLKYVAKNQFEELQGFATQPIIETRTHQRFEKTYEITTNKQSIRDFKIISDQNNTQIIVEGEKAYAKVSQAYGNYRVMLTFTDIENPEISFSKFIDVNTGNINELQAINENSKQQEIFKLPPFLQNPTVIFEIVLFFALFGFIALKEKRYN